MEIIEGIGEGFGVVFPIVKDFVSDFLGKGEESAGNDRALTTTLVISGVIYLRGVLKSERLIAHIVEAKTADEERDLKTEIDNELAMIENELYDAMERFVYTGSRGYSINTENEFREPCERMLSIVRRKKKIPIRAVDFLDDYHDAVRKTLFKKMNRELYSWLSHKAVAVLPFEEDREQKIAKKFIVIMFAEIHKKAGSNEFTRDVEQSIIHYDVIYEMVKDVCETCRELRAKREAEVEAEKREHRIPLFPKGSHLFSWLKSKKRKKRVRGEQAG